MKNYLKLWTLALLFCFAGFSAFAEEVNEFLVTDVEAPEDIVWERQPLADSYKLKCTAVLLDGTPIASDSLTFFFDGGNAFTGWMEADVYYNYNKDDQAYTRAMVYFADLKRMNTPSIRKASVANGKVTAEIKAPKGVKPTKKDAAVLPKFYLVSVWNNNTYGEEFFTAEQIASPIEFKLKDTTFVGGYIDVRCGLDTYVEDMYGERIGTAGSDWSKAKFFGTYTKANATFYAKSSGKDKVKVSWKAPKAFTHYEITFNDEYDFTKKYPANFIYDFNEGEFYVAGKGKSISFNATTTDEIGFNIILWTADYKDSVKGYASCSIPKANFKKLLTVTQGLTGKIVLTNTSPYIVDFSAYSYEYGHDFFDRYLAPYESFTYTNPIPGADYRIEAEVYDAAGYLGKIAPVTAWAAFEPINPAHVVADQRVSFQEIKVTWLPVKGAEAYKVYRVNPIDVTPFVGEYRYNFTRNMKAVSGWVTQCQFVDVVNPMDDLWVNGCTYVVIPAKKGGKRAADDLTLNNFADYATDGCINYRWAQRDVSYTPGVEMHFAADSVQTDKGLWDEKWSGKATASFQYWDWNGKAPKLKKSSMKFVSNTDTNIVFSATAEIPTYNVKHYNSAIKSDITTDSYFDDGINGGKERMNSFYSYAIFTKLPGLDKKYAKSSFAAGEDVFTSTPEIDSVSEYNMDGLDTVKLSATDFMATGSYWGTKAPKAFIEYIDGSKPAGKRVVQLPLKVESTMTDSKGEKTFVHVKGNSAAKFIWGKAKPPKGPATFIIKTSKGIGYRNINIVD